MTTVQETIPSLPAADSVESAHASMPLVEHLRELRRRVLICAAVIVVTTTVAWFSYNHVVAFMVSPYRDYLQHHASKNFALGNLVTSGPLEGFTARLRVSFYLGITLAAPIWLWQFWQFVSPGLRKIEKRYAGSFIVSAVTLFSMGVATAILVFPKAIAWMIAVSGNGVAPLFSPSSYFGLYSLCCLLFGVVFTYPVILVFLEIIGVLPSAKLRKWRRHAIVLIVAIAAVITPSNDPFSFMAMALPMLIFYEASVLVGRVLKK